MPRPRESQTSDVYAKILEIVGGSKKPLSAYEIKKLVGNSDVYRIIRVLRPASEEYLFELRNLLGRNVNQEYKRSLFRRLCEIFQRERELNVNSYSYDENYFQPSIQIEHEQTGKEGTFTYLRCEGFRFYFVIFLDPAGSGNLKLYESGNDKLVNFRRLRYCKDGQKLNIYCEIFRSYKHSYLSVTLSEKALKSFESIENDDPDRFRKENSIKFDQKNLKYVLKLRGLLKLIYEIRLKKNSRRRIRRVLSNPSLKPEVIAPFLLYWQDFENAGYDVIEAIVQISSEFFNHLDQFHWNDDYLLHQVTERYYKQLSGFFRHQDHNPTFEDWKTLDLETRNKLNNYRVHILNLAKGWFQKELTVINDDIEYYSKNPNISRPI